MYEKEGAKATKKSSLDEQELNRMCNIKSGIYDVHILLGYWGGGGDFPLTRSLFCHYSRCQTAFCHVLLKLKSRILFRLENSCSF